MPLKIDWPCWEIMKCNPEQATHCPAFRQEKQCWEVMREIDTLSFNICRDCIVYVMKQKDSIFSEDEIESIVRRKGLDAKDHHCPQFRAVG